jgi:hypothetical protein
MTRVFKFAKVILVKMSYNKKFFCYVRQYLKGLVVTMQMSCLHKKLNI